MSSTHFFLQDNDAIFLFWIHFHFLQMEFEMFARPDFVELDAFLTLVVSLNLTHTKKKVEKLIKSFFFIIVSSSNAACHIVTPHIYHMVYND